MTIATPKRNEKRAVARRIVECLAQFEPVTAALVHLYGYIYPSQFEKDVELFWEEMTSKINDHDEQIDRLVEFLSPRAAASVFAMDVACQILRFNDTGRLDPADLEPLSAAFPDASQELLEEAVAELESLGYLKTSPAIGKFAVRLRPTSSLFLAFDIVATGNNTRADAVEIARIWLEDETQRSVFRLSERLGWTPRRLNPALGALHQFFPDGRWSKEAHPTLETISVVVTPEERFKLRRIVESGRVD